MNNMHLTLLMNAIDGTEQIRIVNHNTLKTLYKGQKFNAPFIDAEVHGIYTCNGVMIISVL